jgi:sulfide:quinone oxidoreductase
MRTTRIASDYEVAGQIEYSDVASLSKKGVKTIINNRPDGEDSRQPLSKAIGKAAKKEGIAYYHIPVKSGRITAENVEELKKTLEGCEGPVLAFCRSGARAKTLYKSATRIQRPGFFKRLFGK